jgi:hypothetical protein
MKPTKTEILRGFFILAAAPDRTLCDAAIERFPELHRDFEAMMADLNEMCRCANKLAGYLTMLAEFESVDSPGRDESVH